jgi:3-oxoacyl-[acyl-carrier-protein] synthase II
MTRLVFTGCGVVSAAGAGLDAMVAALSARSPVLSDVTGMYGQELPCSRAHAFVGLDVRAMLGRKGTGFIDRATALALIACGQAISDSGLVVDDSSHERIGIALGTTVGSFSSSSEYSRETLVAERPYLVNPMLFPNTVMNCAAGQAAIRYGLKGVNSTVAGGRLGFLSALGYAVNVLRRGYADVMLVGAVEEFTPHAAWMHERLGWRGRPGEAAVFFVLERCDQRRAQGREPLAELSAMAAGYQPGEDPAELGDRLAGCASNALRRAGVQPADVVALAVNEASSDDDDVVESAVMAVAPAGRAARIEVRDVLGDCGATGGALQFAALLARERCGRQAWPGLLAGWSADGAFAAAVVAALRA